MPVVLVETTADYAAPAALPLTTVPGLDVALSANISYKFEYTLLWFAAAGTTGLNIAVNGPAATYLRYSWILHNGAAAVALGGSNVYEHAVRTGLNSASVVATNPNMSIVRGVVTPSAAGTLSCRVAPDAAAAFTVLRGSYGLVAS